MMLGTTMKKYSFDATICSLYVVSIYSVNFGNIIKAYVFFNVWTA